MKNCNSELWLGRLSLQREQGSSRTNSTTASSYDTKRVGRPHSHRGLLWYGSEAWHWEYPGLCSHFSQFTSYWQCQSVCSSLKKKKKIKQENYGWQCIFHIYSRKMQSLHSSLLFIELATVEIYICSFNNRKSYQNPSSLRWQLQESTLRICCTPCTTGSWLRRSDLSDTRSHSQMLNLSYKSVLLYLLQKCLQGSQWSLSDLGRQRGTFCIIVISAHVYMVPFISWESQVLHN